MINQHLNYAGLIVKHLRQTISGAEQMELDAWLAESPANHQLLDHVSSDTYLQRELQELASFSEEAAWKKFQAMMSPSSTVVPLKSRKTLWLRVAASVVLLASLGWLIKLALQPGSKEVEPVAAKQQIEIKPGTDKAYLQLADGTLIALDSVVDGTLANQGMMQVSKKDHMVSYSGQVTGTEMVYNTITTPRGGEYQLQLADGTNVWLNAASSIRFPVAFPGPERNVEITGEVYFEVARNIAKPFRVQLPGKRVVEVLGTHFNVNAYSDEQSVNTTLLEGSVRVLSADGQVLQLKPGQQAQIAASGNKVLNDVDVDEIVSWKEGWFNFNRTDISAIMRQVSRWYDVEVVFEGPVSQKTFSGVVSRKHNITEVLKIMEKAGVKFRIEERKVTVLQ